MIELTKELIIGAIGSVIGALIVYLGQTGSRITKKTRERARESRLKEKSAWESGNLEIQQSITNHYLFTVLRYLFLGNLLWLVPEFSESPMEMLGIIYEVYLIIVILARGAALLCFFLGIGSILRYLRLRALDESPSGKVRTENHSKNALK